MKFDKDKLLNLCLQVTDGTHDTPKTLDQGIPFIKGKNISKGFIDFESCEYISYEDHLKIIKRSKPERGDILFANIGNSIGDTAFVKTTLEFSIKNVALIKPQPKIINNLYLYYIFISPSFQNEVKARRQGSAQPFVGLDYLRNHEIFYIVELEDQRKIAAILSAYDDLIENNTRRIALLEEMARRLYQEWFVHFRFPGHQSVPLVDSSLGPIPQGWQVKKLGEIIDFQNGKAIQNVSQGRYPVFGSNGIIGYTDETRFKNAVIIGRVGANCGSILYCNSEFWASDNTIVAISGKDFSIELSFYLLSSLNLRRYAGGSAQPLLTQTVIREIKVPVPFPALNNKFKLIVGNILSRIALLEKKNANLRATRDLLLPRLISGELDVENLEIAVPSSLEAEQGA